MIKKTIKIVVVNLAKTLQNVKVYIKAEML